MGTVLGHRGPGVMLMLLGAHHAIGLTGLLVASDAQPSRSWYSWPGVHWMARLAVEPMLKVILSIVLVTIEVYAKDLNPARTYWRPLQSPDDGHVIGPHVDLWGHATMYLGFTFMGAIELFGVGLTRCHARDVQLQKLVASLSLVVTSLAYGCQAAGMFFHAIGQEGIWSRAHLILAIFSTGPCLAAAAEASTTPIGSARLAPIIRTATVMLTGAWLLHIASMLEHRAVWESDHMALHALPVIATIMVLQISSALLLGMLLLGTILHRHRRPQYHRSDESSLLAAEEACERVPPVDAKASAAKEDTTEEV